MRPYLVILAVLASGASTFERAEARREDLYAASYSSQASARYNGATVAAAYETSTDEQWRLGLSAVHLGRKYDGGASVSDSSFALSGTKTVDTNSYFESRVELSPDAEIFAKSIFNLTPHHVFGSTDVSLGLDYRVYATSVAGSLRPNIRYEFSDSIAFALGSYVVRSSDTLVANHFDLTYKPFANHFLRTSVAGGRSLEDAGVSASFSSVFFSYGYRLERFTISVDVSKYWSDLRTETSTGLRIEFR